MMNDSLWDEEVSLMMQNISEGAKRDFETIRQGLDVELALMEDERGRKNQLSQLSALALELCMDYPHCCYVECEQCLDRFATNLAASSVPLLNNRAALEATVRQVRARYKLGEDKIFHVFQILDRDFISKQYLPSIDELAQYQLSKRVWCSKTMLSNIICIYDESEGDEFLHQKFNAWVDQHPDGEQEMKDAVQTARVKWCAFKMLYSHLPNNVIRLVCDGIPPT